MNEEVIIMTDSLLLAMKDIALLLIPVAGLACLIYLAIVLYRVSVVVKGIPSTLERVNKTLEEVNTTISTTQGIVDKLNEPMDTVVEISRTVDSINKATNSFVGSVASYAVKNSDSIVNWTKGFFNKEEKKPKETTSEDSKEEDFGVYE